MEIVFIMIGLSLLMAIGFLLAFIWTVKTGQQDDLITPGLRIITEEIDIQKNKIK
jgi:cbb3-type cytochrome oxidase maturation protein